MLLCVFLQSETEFLKFASRTPGNLRFSEYLLSYLKKRNELAITYIYYLTTSAQEAVIAAHRFNAITTESVYCTAACDRIALRKLSEKMPLYAYATASR